MDSGVVDKTKALDDLEEIYVRVLIVKGMFLYIQLNSVKQSK